MRLRRFVGAAAAVAALGSGVLALVPAPALADDPRTLQDIRCVIVGATLSGSDDPQLKQLGELSVLYFWGRLQAREAMANIEARVLEEQSRMSAADVTREARTCEAMVTGAGEEIQDLAKTIQQRMGGGGVG